LAFRKILFSAAILLVTTAAFVFYFYHQPVASYAQVPLMDANQYLKSYHYFKGDTAFYQVIFPINARILVPWLATLIPATDADCAFQILNLVFSLLSVGILLRLWQQMKFGYELIFIGFFWLLFHWTGLIRLNAFDPVTVDVPLYLFQTLFLWIVLRRQWVHLWWLAPLATIQKESFPALLIVLLLYGWLYNRYTKTRTFPVWPLAMCLVLAAISKAVVNYYFPPVKPGNSLITILFFIKESLIDPFRLVRWIAGVFVAFGGWLLLVLWQWTSTGAFAKLKNTLLTKPRQWPVFKNTTTDLLLLFSVTYLGLSLLAGGDFTRIVFLGFPFVMTYILLVIRQCSQKLRIAAGLLSLPLMRLTEIIPDPAADWTAFINWYPEFATWPVVCQLWVYGVVVFMVFWLLKKYGIRRNNA